MDRQTIANRVKALLSKTTENGATEAEALSAAEKARELMDKYHLEHGELGMEAEGVLKAFSENTAYKTLKIKWQLAARVMEFCDVTCWREASSGKLVFFGLQSDADFATWLVDSLDAFVRRSAAEYMMNVPKSALNPAYKMPRWEAEKAFVLGCISRINARMHALTTERKRARQAQAGLGDLDQARGGGRSLIVIKNDIVQKALKDLGVKLGKRSSGSSARINERSSFEAGRAAGDRASFGRPVNGGAGTRQIGRA